MKSVQRFESKAQVSTQIEAPVVQRSAESQVKGPVDQIVSGGPAAQIPVAQQEARIGRPGSQTSIQGPVICPQPLELSPELLARAAGLGGAGIKGRGTLSGEIAIQSGKVYLITAAKGSKSEVKFQLDMKLGDARKLAGEQVQINGMIDKKTSWSGKITGAKLVGEVGGESVKLGTYQVLSGKIENRSLMGIGGEAPPSGSYLVLDKPITVEGKQIKEVFVQRWPEMAEGSQVTLNGRVDRRNYGGVETPAASVISLTGVSDLSAGEPKFDGKVFTNDLGKELKQLSYNRPLMWDAPAQIFVLDEAHDTAFIGGMGGMIPPDMNPFHGFRGKAKIEQPTDADRAAVVIGPEGTPRNASTLKELVLIGSSGDEMGPHPDMLVRNYYFDEDANAIYRLDSGGIAGFMQDMFEVIRLPQE